MKDATREALLDEYERHSRIIKASEAWSPEYFKSESAHAKLINAEAALERIIKSHFKRMSDEAIRFINWDKYNGAIQAYNVDVIVDNDNLDDEDGTLFNVIFDTVTAATAAGAQAGQDVYKYDLNMDELTAVIQKTAREQVANLVGKRVLPDGTVVNNPNAEYRITDALRDDIKQSIHTSISLNENQAQAVERLRKVINNGVRAEMIARTEAVNGFQRGLFAFGTESGAVGKEWQAIGAMDVCGEYAFLGAVPFDYVYEPVRRIVAPTAHPNCRCGLRLIYQNEVDKNPDLIRDPKDAPRPKPKDKVAPEKKGPTETAPKPKVEKPAEPPKSITIENNGVSHTFDFTPREAAFVQASGLKIEMELVPKHLTGGTQGVYMPYYHKLLVKPPDKVAKEAKRPGAFTYDHVFHHELAHAIDHKFSGTQMSRSTYHLAVVRDRDAVVFNRLKINNPDMPDEALKLWSKGRRWPQVNSKGEPVLDPYGRQRQLGMKPSFTTYLRSGEEVWADAYAQYKTDSKAFKKYAPNLWAAFEELGT